MALIARIDSGPEPKLFAQGLEKTMTIITAILSSQERR